MLCRLLFFLIYYKFKSYIRQLDSEITTLKRAVCSNVFGDKCREKYSKILIFRLSLILNSICMQLFQTIKYILTLSVFPLNK